MKNKYENMKKKIQRNMQSAQHISKIKLKLALYIEEKTLDIESENLL